MVLYEENNAYEFFSNLSDADKIHYADYLLKSIDVYVEVDEVDEEDDEDYLFPFEEDIDDESVVFEDEKLDDENIEDDIDNLDVHQYQDNYNKSGMYISSEYEEDVERFIYENLFIRGFIIKILKDSERPKWVKKRYFTHVSIIGALSHDVSYS